MGVITVTGNDGTPYDFEIEGDQPTVEESAKIKRYIGDQEAGPMSSVGASFRRFGAGVQTGIGALADDLGFEETGQSLLDSADETRATVSRRYQPEVPDITEAEDLGDVATFGIEQLGASTPWLAAGLGGAYAGGKAGALAGSVFGPVGTAAGGVLGSLAGSILATAPAMFGDLIDEKARTQGIEDKDVDVGTAAVAALGQASLNSLFDRFLVGRMGRIFNGVSRDVAKRGFAQALGLAARRAVATGAVGAGTEGVTETAQQVISVAHRDPDAFVEMWEKGEIPESVQKELINAFAGGFLVGGSISGATGVAAGVGQARRENRVIEQREEDAEFNRQARAEREQEIYRELSPSGELPEGIAGLLPAPQQEQLQLSAREGIGVEGEGDIVPDRAERPSPTAQEKGERDARVAATEARYDGPAQVRPEAGQFRVRARGKMVGRLYRSAEEAQQAADRYNGEYIARAQSEEEIQRRRQEVIDGNRETIQAARETTLPFPPLDLSELAPDQAGEIRMYRVMFGDGEVDAPVSMDEVRHILGDQVYDEIAARLKPLTLGRGAVQPNSAAGVETEAGKAPPASQVRSPSSVAAETELQSDQDVVGPNGLLLVHGTSRPGLSLSDVEIVRAGAKQGKRGRKTGGFYASSVADIDHAEGYSKMNGQQGEVLDVVVAPGTRVLRKEGDITRISEQQIADWTSQGYGLVIGKDPRGRTEYVVIDKNAIQSLSPRGRGEAAIPSAPTVSEEEYAFVASKARERGGVSYDEVKSDLEEVRGREPRPQEVNAVLETAIARGDIYQKSPGEFRLSSSMGRQRRNTPAELPEGRSEFFVQPTAIDGPYVLERGKKKETFDSREAAARRLREIKSKNPTSKASIRPAREGYSVVESRLDEQGNVIGRASVAAYDNRAEAEADLLSRTRSGDFSPLGGTIGRAPDATSQRDQFRPETIERAPGIPIRRSGRGPFNLRDVIARNGKPTPEVTDKLSSVEADLRKRLDEVGLGHIALRLVKSIKAPNGQTAEGVYDQGIISLATDIAGPDATPEQVRDALSQVMDHEMIHALREAGVFTDAEWQSLMKMTKNARRPDNGKTFYQDAFDRYSDIEGYDQTAVEEEAVADAFRYWNTGELRLAGRPRTLLGRIVSFFQAVARGFRDNGFRSSEEIFGGINRGQYSDAVDGNAVNTNLGARFSMGGRDFILRFGYLADKNTSLTQAAVNDDAFKAAAAYLNARTGEVASAENVDERVMLNIDEDTENFEAAGAGEVTLTIHDGGRLGHVEWTNWRVADAPAFGDLKPNEIRSIAKAVKVFYPKMEYIFGYRVSGGKDLNGMTQPIQVVPVKKLKPAITRELKRGAEVNTREVNFPAIEPDQKYDPSAYAGKSLDPSILGKHPSARYSLVPRKPNKVAQNIAAQYRQQYGIQKQPLAGKVYPPQELMVRLADIMDAQPTQPDDPNTLAAYSALAKETLQQFDMMGALEVTPYRGEGEPYRNSGEALDDIQENNHLYFFMTESGYGDGNPDDANNPLLQPSGKFASDGTPLLVNDVFRIVHDYFGHAQHALQFGPVGELNAFLEHATMYTDQAVPALAAETLMQNAWVNFGPHLRREDGSLPEKGDKDYVAPADRPFSDQKVFAAPADILSTVSSLTPAQRFSLPPSDSSLSEDQAIARGSLGRTLEAMDRIIPVESRAVGRWERGVGLVDPDGTPVYETVVKSEKSDFAEVDEQIVRAAFDDAIAKTMGHGDATANAMQSFIANRPEFQPPSAKFVNEMLDLPQQARYWYELSAVGMLNRVRLKGADAYKRFFDIVGATSQQADPKANQRRALSVLSDEMRGFDIQVDLLKDKPVRDALSGIEQEGLKVGSFANTFSYVSGLSEKPPLSVNDRQVASTFGVTGDDLARNPWMYEALSRFYINLRDVQNDMLANKNPNARPYETWHLQSLSWVKERQRKKEVGYDDFDTVLKNFTEELSREGIENNGYLTPAIIASDEFSRYMNQTGQRLRTNLVGTMEVNTVQNDGGRLAAMVKDMAEEKGDRLIQRRYAQNMNRAMAEMMKRTKKPRVDVTGKVVDKAQMSPIGRMSSAIVGRNTDIRLIRQGMGYFGGVVSPNIRIPMFYGKDVRGKKVYEPLADGDVEALLSYMGRALKQEGMAASQFSPEPTGKPGETYSYSAFVPTYSPLSSELIAEFAQAIEAEGVGMSVNIKEGPNGVRFDVIPPMDANYEFVPVDPDALAAVTMKTLGDTAVLRETNFRSIYVDQSQYDQNIRRVQRQITQEAIDSVASKAKIDRKRAKDYLSSGSEDILGKASASAREGASRARERLRSRRDALTSASSDIDRIARELEEANLKLVGDAYERGYRFNDPVDNDLVLSITGPRRFSLGADPEQHKAVHSPRTNSPIYGKLPFFEEDLPFVLFSGFHQDNIDGRGSGFGMAHAGRHTEELRRATKLDSIPALLDNLSRAYAAGGSERQNMDIRFTGNRLTLDWDGSKFRSPVRFIFEKRTAPGGKPFLSLVTAHVAPTVLQRGEGKGRGKGARYSLGEETLGRRVPRMSAVRTNRANHTIQYTMIADGLRNAMQKGARIFGKKGYQRRAQKWGEASDSFVTNFQDRMMPVGRMLDEIKRLGGTVTDAFDTYMQEELFHGRVGEELRRREDGLYRPAFDAIRKVGLTDRDVANLEGMSDAARKYVEYDESRNPSQIGVELYLYARHARERNAYIQSFQDPEDSGMKDIGSGMTGAEADRILAYFNGHKKRDALLSAVNQIDGIIANTNQTRLQAGLISQDVIDASPFDNYVPLRGFAEDPDADDPAVGFGKGFKVQGREDRRALGRDSVADNILEHVLLQNEEAVIRSEKNRVGQSFVNLIRANGKLIAPIAEVVKNPPLVRRKINGVTRTVVDGNYKQSADILVVKENGQEVAVRIKDPRIAKAMTGAAGIGSDTLGSIVGSIGVVTQTLARLSTSWNPEFMLSNFPRDVQTALINSQQYDGAPMTAIFKNSFASIPAIRRTIRDGNASGYWGQRYMEFRDAGGQTEFYGLRSIDQRIRKINDALAEDLSGAPNKAKKAIQDLGDFLEDYNLVFENATRVAVFDALVKAGYSHERAAQAGRNVTVNFNKKGEKGTLVNALYMFYNAAIQGSMAMANAAVRSKKVRKILGTVAMVGFMQDILNSLMSDDEDDGVKTYDKIPDWVLEHNLILMDPLGLTDRGFISITLPYGFNAVYNFGRSMARAARGGYTPGEAAKSALGTMVDAFNPIGGTESFLNFVVPTVLDPVVNLSINEDFAERPIYPEASPFGISEPASQRYWNNTAIPYVKASEYLSKLTGGDSYIPGAVELSPNTLQFITEYFTGGAGMFVRRIVQFGTETMPAALTGDLEEMDLSQVPVIRKLGGNVTTRNDMERFIEVRDDVLRVRRSITAAAEQGDYEAIRRFRQSYPEEVRIMEQINALNNARSQLQSKIREIERSRLPDDYKSTVIRRLKDRQDALVGRANAIANQAGV